MSEPEMAALISWSGSPRLAAFSLEKQNRPYINRGKWPWPSRKTALYDVTLEQYRLRRAWHAHILYVHTIKCSATETLEWSLCVTFRKKVERLKLIFISVRIMRVQAYRMCVFSGLSCLSAFFCARRKPPCARSVPVAIVSATLMDSSHPVSFSSLCLFLPYHIHVFPRGLIKRLSSWGEGRREEREEERSGGWQWRRVVLITPYVWTGEGGVEVLFLLINRDTVLLRSLCLSVSLSFSLSPLPSTLRLSH